MLADTLFDAIDQLLGVEIWSVEDLETRLRIPLAPDSASSTEFFQVYSGRAAGGDVFTEAEYRHPRQPRPPGLGGLLILTISPRLRVDRAELLRRWGEEESLLPPDPSAPPGGLVYLGYEREEAAVRVGLAQATPSLVRTVVLDRTETRRE